MKHDQTGPADVEPHVFDQTNGVVDLGEDGPAQSDADRAAAGKPDRRSIAGIAMLSVKKP